MQQAFPPTRAKPLVSEELLLLKNYSKQQLFYVYCAEKRTMCAQTFLAEHYLVVEAVIRVYGLWEPFYEIFGIGFKVQSTHPAEGYGICFHLNILTGRYASFILLSIYTCAV